MRDSSWLSGMGMIMAADSFFTHGTDVEWLTTFMIFCAGFIVKALEDLKGEK